MRTGCFIILALIALLALGCHQSPQMSAHLQLMNAEKRALEDELYALEFDYEDAVHELEKLRKENENLRGSAGLPQRGSAPAPRRNGSSSGKDSSNQKSDLMPPMVDEGMLVEPRIEMPSNQPSRDLPRPNNNAVPPDAPPTLPGAPPRSSKRPDEGKTPVSLEEPNRAWSLEPGDPRVSHIFLNPLLTGGSDFDRQPGDDGIVVVIEPRNREEKFVPLAGPITVVVLDPEKTPEQGRVVARWEIAANTAQQALQNTATVRGIQLKLPWPDSPPTINRLHLFVRYVTVDNRDLRADREVFLTLPGQFSQRWTPRAATRGTNSSATTDAELQLPAATDSSPSAEQAARPEWRPYR
jgi:hypothetical protein